MQAVLFEKLREDSLAELARGVGIGDLSSDVLSARAAGLGALGVSWGYGEATALIRAGAERVCETADELAQALQRRVVQH